jgi:multidrug efflux pump
MLSDIAVRRPVFATVIALILTLVGLAAFVSLPLRELPNIDPPVVSIQTVYTGASAEVIESRITRPVERQIAGIQGIDRINSSSRDGVSNISITFTLKRDLEAAANDVRDRVSRVLSQLPENVLSPQINKADADSSPMMVVSFRSKTMGRLEISDYADRYLIPRLSTVPGVAQVFAFGSQLYSMRIWLNSSALSARGLSVEDVEAALNNQNVQLPAGSIEANAKDYTINVDRSYMRPSDFAALPVAGKAGAAGGYVTRLGDVARIEEGPDERRRLFRSEGAEMIGLGIIRQSQANDLEISKDVKETVDAVNKTLPAGTVLDVIVDNSVFTKEAVKEVYITLALSLFLVAMVNLLFLGSWRAALIPTVVAPVCVICTFMVLAPLGFSVNLLTLLALVLAIGLVVDDAIVVVENIQRRVDEGEPPLVAAQRGARQVFFAVVATTLVLVSVFAPLMFLPGYIGRLFVELAVAIAASVLFSAFLALSLSPMLASKLLQPASQKGRIAKLVDTAVDSVRASYRTSLSALIGRRSAAGIAGGFVLGLALCSLGLFIVLPKELVPDEDRGRVDISVQAPEGAGFDYTMGQTLKIEPIIQAMEGPKGEVARYMLVLPRAGQTVYNSGFGFTVLKPWNERKRSATEIAGGLNKTLSRITGARVVASVRGPFQRGGGGGGGGGSNVDLIISGPEYEGLAKWSEPILKAARANPGLTRVSTDYEPDAPRLVVTVDRDRAASLGVTAAQVGEALDVMFGPKKVTTYIRQGQEYDVLLQTELEHRRTLADLETVYVRSSSGGQVPLSNVVKTEVRGDLANRQRVDQLRAITITAFLNPGYTVADSVKFYEDEIAKLPAGPVIKWGGQAKDYLDSGNGVLYAFGFALLVVFLVLAAQFESFVHPAVIMLTVPLAAAGGLFGLLMAGSTINIYSQIGLIILIGIAAKNGILIVEFANQRRDEGLSIVDAVVDAADTRLRPIVMTSIAAAAGAAPLILQQGPGSGSRHTIGVVIFAGAIFATLVTLFVVPVFYGVFARFAPSPDAARKAIERYEQDEAARAGQGS